MSDRNSRIMEKLCPCPFCGSFALEVRHIGNEHTRKRKIMVRCRTCRIERTDATLSGTFDSIERVAIKNWNQRPTPKEGE